ncbi:hypothetical protein BJV78DRAFT_1290549 [Lactifluus subvellereus]|nr:hypothetical protein BJV78DRAFT_1290549 [Lactifluus subvellereus]
MAHCPGCGKWFYPGGYLNHLQQTHKPECHAVLTQSHWHGDLLNSDSDNEADSHLDAPWEGLAGGGGLSVENDREQGSSDLEDEDEDEDEDLMDGGDNYQEWEALVPEQPGRQGEMGEDEPEVHQGEDELYGAQEARWAAEEAFRKTPVVEPFLSIEAGAHIAHIHTIPKCYTFPRRPSHQCIATCDPPCPATAPSHLEL